MKKQFQLIVALFALATLFIQSSFAQTTCVELGVPVGQLSSILKGTGGFCPTPAQSNGVCDCPSGFVAVGYEGTQGNVYGAMVLSEFALRCRQLNPDGTLGIGVVVTCDNGTSMGSTAAGPVTAPGNEAMVGAEVRIGCAIDAIMGESKLMSEIITGQPNSNSNAMPPIGGTGGTPQPVMYVPDGNVIVGMETFIDPGNNPAGAMGLAAGIAWRFAPVVTVPCPTTCSVDGIMVSNISLCNDNGTPTNPADDTFTADVMVTFTAPPTTGNLNLSGDGTASVAVGGIGMASHTFTGVTMSADGGAISLTASFSATPACTLTNNNAGTAPGPCAVAPPCAITDISTSNLSGCNDSGTPSITGDDTFTADVTVSFSNPPAGGILLLTGDGIANVSAAALSGSSHTFTGVSMAANGTPINLTAGFSAASGCTLTNNNAGMAPGSCSPLSPTIPTMSEWGLILFALIIFTLTVVFGTQQQRAMAMSSTTGEMAATNRWQLPFDKGLFFKVLPYVYLGFVAIFASAILLFGYELTNADVPGSLLSGLVIAYLIQFVMKSSNRG